MAMAHSGETLAKREIENLGFQVHDANIVFRANCPNIDLIVFAKKGGIYVQVKSSRFPAGLNCVAIDGSPWTQEQLYSDAPLFNRHDNFQAQFVVVVDTPRTGEVRFFIAPPTALEALARPRGREWAEHPKRDGATRSIKFRKELPREMLAQWHNAWHQLGEPPAGYR